MGTPLKTLTSVLSPKMLSPLSPRLLSVSKLGGNVTSRIVSSNIQRISSAKNFEYPKFAKNSNRLFDQVNIHVTDCGDKIKEVSKHDVFINSPMKRDIIQNGVEDDKFLNILGKGSFGKVIRAVHKGTTVAMKLVKSSTFSSRENNALCLCHRNIVKTLNVIGSEKSTFSIILMEYFSVCHVMQSILDASEITLDDETIVKYANDVCNGLLHCHDNGILHLDLKPQNVLICEGVCKICDFGNSVKISEIGDNFEHQGTAIYTAPEILQGKKPSEKSDVYSFGILFWQMISRKQPYSDIDNIETVMYMVVKCHLRPDMKNSTDKFSDLYQNCWNSNPIHRPNVADILNILSNF